MENNNTDNTRAFRLSIIWIVMFSMFGFYIAQAQEAVQQYSDSF